MADTKTLLRTDRPASTGATLRQCRACSKPFLDPVSSPPPLAEEEEITPETAAAMDRARASLARGEGIPHEEILREFGLNK